MIDEDFKKFLEAQMSWDCSIINLDAFSWKLSPENSSKYNVSNNSKLLNFVTNDILYPKNIYTISTIIQRKYRRD